MTACTGCLGLFATHSASHSSSFTSQYYVVLWIGKIKADGDVNLFKAVAKIKGQACVLGDDQFILFIMDCNSYYRWIFFRIIFDTVQYKDWFSFKKNVNAIHRIDAFNWVSMLRMQNRSAVIFLHIIFVSFWQMPERYFFAILYHRALFLYLYFLL